MLKVNTQKNSGSLSLLATSLLIIIPAFCPAEDEEPIEEVIVTAQKRAESMQDIPVSVSAFSSEMVERMNFQSASDLVAQVPNMAVSNSFGEAQQPFLRIRGIGLNNFNDSFEAPVALYIDDVYTGSLMGQTAQLFDVERIEVLKGPQGTLYGRNTTGGLIHVISRKPTDELEVRLEAEYADYEQLGLTAAVSGPLAPGVRARVAAKRRVSDGWATGFLDGVEYTDEDTVALRGILDIDLGERGLLRMNAHYSEIDALSVGFGLRGYLDPVTGERCSLARIESGNCVSPSLGGRSANDLGGLRPGATPGSNLPADRGRPPEQYVKLTGTSARLEWDFEAWTLTAIGAYDEVSKLYEEDLDADGFFFDDGLSLEAEEFKAELRAAGQRSGWTWLVGIFYLDDSKDTGSFLLPVELFRTRGIVDTESWAAFGQVDIPLSETVWATVGARYTEEDKALDFSRTGFINDSGRRAFQSEDLTGRLALSWEPRDDLLIYSSVSTGFKTGGFNTQFVFGSLEEIDLVDNEEITAYEVGLKSDWLEGRLRLNAAAFKYDYRDIQLTVFTTIPGAPFPSNFLRNAGDADIHGVDIELAAAPFEHTEIRLGAGLIDTELQSDQIIESAGVTKPLDGNELTDTPGATFNVLLLHEIPLSSQGAVFVETDYSWQDKSFFSIENVDTESRDAYGVLNLRAGWRSPDEHFQLEAYLENALDEEYSLFNVDLDPTFGVVTWGRPRWWGLRLSYQ